jgi:hypothetical protein
MKQYELQLQQFKLLLIHCLIMMMIETGAGQNGNKLERQQVLSKRQQYSYWNKFTIVH